MSLRTQFRRLFELPSNEFRRGVCSHPYNPGAFEHPRSNRGPNAGKVARNALCSAALAKRSYRPVSDNASSRLAAVPAVLAVEGRPSVAGRIGTVGAREAPRQSLGPSPEGDHPGVTPEPDVSLATDPKNPVTQCR